MADDRSADRVASTLATLATLAVLAFVLDVFTGGGLRDRVSTWAASFGPQPELAGAPASDVAAVLRAAETITREGR